MLNVCVHELLLATLIEEQIISEDICEGAARTKISSFLKTDINSSEPWGKSLPSVVVGLVSSCLAFLIFLPLHFFLAFLFPLCFPPFLFCLLVRPHSYLILSSPPLVLSLFVFVFLHPFFFVFIFSSSHVLILFSFTLPSSLSFPSFFSFPPFSFLCSYSRSPTFVSSFTPLPLSFIQPSFKNLFPSVLTSTHLPHPLLSSFIGF